MRTFLIAMGLLLALFVTLRLLPPPSKGAQPISAVQTPPWQIEVLPDGGSRVFGLTLGTSTLADAQAVFGGEGELAAVAAPGGQATVEAYYNDFAAGGITGKVVLTADLAPEAVNAMWKRAEKVEYMQGTTKKARLADDDAAKARLAPVRGIAFVPGANLDQAVVEQRFGKAAERLRTGPETEHFLYPDRGLDIALSSKDREVIQYVAPRDFAALRRPLIEAQPAASQP